MNMLETIKKELTKFDGTKFKFSEQDLTNKIRLSSNWVKLDYSDLIKIIIDVDKSDNSYELREIHKVLKWNTDISKLNDYIHAMK